jgi:hypothetical protein
MVLENKQIRAPEGIMSPVYYQIRGLKLNVQLWQKSIAITLCQYSPFQSWLARDSSLELKLQRVFTHLLAVQLSTHRVALLDTVAKEWEDLISTDESPEFAVLTMPSIWPALLQTRFFKGAQGLLETIEFGNQVQAHHEYQPFYGVLPTTQMPNSIGLTLTPENVASNPEEVLNYEKLYYITADGILIDIVHITDKPRIALQWLMQLKYYELFNAKQANSLSTATINTNYLGGNPNQVEFQVSLATPLCEQTVLTMMSAFTIATEGVMQYEIVAQAKKVPLLADAFKIKSGFSPEDAFTNTLAAHFAYQIFTEPNGKYESLIEQTLNKWLSFDSNLLKPKLLNQLSEKFIYLPEFNELYKEVLERLIAVSPCQPLPEPIVLPTMGFYPFNPVKALKNDLNPQFQFDPPVTTKGVVLTKFPNWAESLPKSGAGLRDRLLKSGAGLRDRLLRFFTGS